MLELRTVLWNSLHDALRGGRTVAQSSLSAVEGVDDGILGGSQRDGGLRSASVASGDGGPSVASVGSEVGPLTDGRNLTGQFGGGDDAQVAGMQISEPSRWVSVGAEAPRFAS